MGNQLLELVESRIDETGKSKREGDRRKAEQRKADRRENLIDRRQAWDDEAKAKYDRRRPNSERRSTGSDRRGGTVDRRTNIPERRGKGLRSGRYTDQHYRRPVVTKEIDSSLPEGTGDVVAHGKRAVPQVSTMGKRTEEKPAGINLQPPPPGGVWPEPDKPTFARHFSNFWKKVSNKLNGEA